MNKDKIAPIEVGIQVDKKAEMPYIHIYTPVEDWDEMCQLRKEIIQLTQKYLNKTVSKSTQGNKS